MAQELALLASALLSLGMVHELPIEKEKKEEIVQESTYYYHILPVQFNKDTDEWYMLLGQNKDNQWTDFKATKKVPGPSKNETEKEKKERFHKAFLQAINDFNALTGYQLDENSIAVKNFQYGADRTHIIEVPYKPAGDIFQYNKKKKNSGKKDFAWISIPATLGEDKNNFNFGKKLSKTGSIKTYLYDTLMNGGMPSKYMKTKESEESENITVPQKNDTTSNTEEACELKCMNGESWPKPHASGSIHFYGNDDTYKKLDVGKFANTYKVTVSIADVRWQSTEEFFQAMKFTNYKPGGSSFTIKNQQGYDAIRNASKSPGSMPSIARKHTRRKDWQKVNFGIMMDALWEKFTQHNDYKKLLLATENAILVEDTARATYVEDMYGAGKSYTGCNVLGQMLMQIRYALRKGNGKPKFTAHPPSFYL